MKETNFLKLNIVEWIDGFNPLVPMNNNATILDGAIETLSTASDKYKTDIENLNTAVNEHNTIIESNTHAITDLQTEQNLQAAQIGTLNTELDSAKHDISNVSGMVGAWVPVNEFQTITQFLGNHALEKNVSESIYELQTEVSSGITNADFTITASNTGSGAAIIVNGTKVLVNHGIFMFSCGVNITSTTDFTLNINVGTMYTISGVFGITVRNESEYNKLLYPNIDPTNKILTANVSELADGNYIIHGIIFVGKDN